MRNIYLLPLALAALSACNQLKNEEPTYEEAASGNQPFFTVDAGVDTFLKIKIEDSSKLMPGTGKCELSSKGKYFVKDLSGPEEGYYKVTLANAIPGCKFATGFVFAEHIAPSQPPSGYCQKSWEEAQIMDYTTFDAYNAMSYATSAHPESKTLMGSTQHKDRTMCERARVLKHCFEKAVGSNESSALKFRNWAKSRRINPVLALMAKTQQETQLGIIPDSCINGNCNGIGIGQIITAIDQNGNKIDDSNPAWRGITHNILTNLKYSVRVIAAKTDMSNSLWDLAYYYNGSPEHQNAYASNVLSFYGQLQKCPL